MAIKGLTDQYAKMDTGPRGRTIRIGWLQKGRREGFGKNIKLYDDDHFNFRAADSNGIGQRLEALFKEVYGERPIAINDVRIPHTLAGNFNVESCAWLTCSKHTEKGSMFIGQSDGEFVSRLRDEETGKVVRFSEAEPVAHTAVTVPIDNTKYGGVRYRGKVYPWQQSMAIDLILTDLNEAMFKERLSGLGVVTLLTHSTYDIPTLISEYYGIINEVVSLWANPFDQNSVDNVSRHIPLRNIPLRLYRSEDAVTTPNWQSKDAGDRLNSTRSLLHWQLAPDFSLAAHQAMNKRTDMTLAAVANIPLLQSGRMKPEEIDDMFSYSESPTKQLAPRVEAETTGGPDWEAFGDDDIVESDFEENEQEQQEDVFDWAQQALAAVSLDALAMALFEVHKQSGVFKDANEAQRGIKHICGDNPENNHAMNAVYKYVQAVADGVSKKEAAAAAKEHYADLMALAF